MANAQWILEVALLLLLAATLFHALRLERALGVLKRDRAVLEELVQGFNESTRLAESGIEKLRLAADGAGRQMARQTESAQKLRDELGFLTERADRLAERLEMAVRSARMFADTAALPPAAVSSGDARDLPPVSRTQPQESVGAMPSLFDPAMADQAPRLRSQAERDLLRVLRTAR